MNMEEIKKKLNALNNKGKQNNMWKATDEHNIRCVQAKGTDDPFIERSFHYDIGGKNLLCPKNFGDDCPICEFADALKSFNDKNGKKKSEKTKEKDWELFKKVQAKTRYYVAVLERGKEKEGVKYWSMSNRNYEDLLKICMNEDLNEGRKDGGGSNLIVNPLTGHDIKVSFKKAGEKGNTTKYSNIDLEPRLKQSKLAEEKEEIERLITSIPPFEEVYPRMSTKEINKAFMDYVNGGAGADGESTEGNTDKEYGGEKVVNSHNGEKLTGTKSVDEAFENLMNE